MVSSFFPNDLVDGLLSRTEYLTTSNKPGVWIFGMIGVIGVLEDSDVETSSFELSWGIIIRSSFFLEIISVLSSNCSSFISLKGCVFCLVIMSGFNNFGCSVFILLLFWWEISSWFWFPKKSSGNIFFWLDLHVFGWL